MRNLAGPLARPDSRAAVDLINHTHPQHPASLYWIFMLDSFKAPHPQQLSPFLMILSVFEK